MGSTLFLSSRCAFCLDDSGVRALLESSALYLELLDSLGSTSDVNEALWRKFNSERWLGAPDPKGRDFVYYGAFTEAHWHRESGEDRPPPYHLVPISLWCKSRCVSKKC